ncbi:MAG: PilZ domain-containing protein [Pseudomonadales bacterium]|nr:PilZ domain-containing protein [Pseudomonadales bacterium]
MATSLLMSKIISLADARRKQRPVKARTMTDMNHEKRHDYRKASHERLFVQIVECENEDLVGTTVSCNALDVSAGGIKVQTGTYIPAGCQLDLWVDMASRPGKFFLTSDVRWVTEASDGQYMFGVQLHEGAATDIGEWKQLHG